MLEKDKDAQTKLSKGFNILKQGGNSRYLIDIRGDENELTVAKEFDETKNKIDQRDQKLVLASKNIDDASINLDHQA